MKQRAACTAIGTAAIGLTCIAWGLWIPAKAALAQSLIEKAWQRARSGEERPRPWPWADTWPVARLTAPRLDVELYALAGASGHALAFGPAHVAVTAAPGSGDNVAFAGHRDTHFAFLRNLALGDELVLESRTHSLRYRVTETRVVHESDTAILERSGRAELTLITCFPFDAIVPGGPLRYIVRASLSGSPTRLSAAAVLLRQLGLHILVVEHAEDQDLHEMMTERALRPAQGRAVDEEFDNVGQQRNEEGDASDPSTRRVVRQYEERRKQHDPEYDDADLLVVHAGSSFETRGWRQNPV
ncbi:MAG: class GN sortase [Deltaproteobacteria bacterium]|nr:class GN sortase [Deltaproteobacteria bacterium]